VESAIEDTDGIDIEYRCKTLNFFSRYLQMQFDNCFFVLVQNIAVNGLLMLIFIAYLILSFIYLLGIAKVRNNLIKELQSY
jgi:hypothetical protein